MKSVFVGNLPYAATEAELRELFERHGKVYDAKIKKDRETGRPLGYGFVLLDDEEAPRVMEALDGFCFGGRSLRVNESKERGRPPRVQGDRKADREFRRPFSREDAAGEKDRPVRRFQEDSGERRPFRPKRPFSGNFSREELRRHTDLFCRRLVELYPDVPVFAILPLWRSDFGCIRNAGTFEDAGKIYRSIYEKYSIIRIIDGFSLIPHDTSLFSDGYLHPNDSGFSQMSKNLIRQIQ